MATVFGDQGTRGENNMLENIIWKESNGKVSEQEIKSVEMKLKIKFPKNYVDIVSQNDGGYPFPNRFKVKENEEIINNLLSFKVDEDSNIMDVFEDVSDRLIEGVVPIAEDPFGNLICFDFRLDKEATIVFWNHEKEEVDVESVITNICDSFTDLLNMLYEN